MPFKTTAQSFQQNLVISKVIKISGVRLRALFTDNWGDIPEAAQKKIDQSRNPVRGSKKAADDLLASLKNSDVDISKKYACILVKQRKVFVAILNAKAATAQNAHSVLEYGSAEDAKVTPDADFSGLDDMMADALSMDFGEPLEPVITEAPVPDFDPLADVMGGLDDMEAQLGEPDDTEPDDTMSMLDAMETHLADLAEPDTGPEHPWAASLPKLRRMLADSHGNTVALIDALKDARKSAPQLSQERERASWILSIYLNDGLTRVFVPVRAPLLDLEHIVSSGNNSKLAKVRKKALKSCQEMLDWLGRVSIPVDAAARHLRLSTNLRSLKAELTTFVGLLRADS